MQDLILHVGLPKTGTTTLQNDFFPQYQGYLGGQCYVRNPGDYLKRFQRIHSTFGTNADFASRQWTASARKWWKHSRTFSNTPLVLSDEVLSQWRLSSQADGWPLLDAPSGLLQVRRGTALLPRFAGELAAALADLARVRVILTLRNQSDFLASLYAQLASGMLAPSEIDFATKVRHLIRYGDTFVDWYSLVVDLQSNLGSENVLVGVFEDGLNEIATDMAKFIDPSWRPTIVLGEHNVRRDTNGAWTWKPRSRIRKVGEITSRVWPPRRATRLRLRVTPLVRQMGLSRVRQIADGISRAREAEFDKQRIEPNEGLRLEIQQACSESNKALGHLLNRDLKMIGY